MKDDFFDGNKKRKGISVTFFIVTIVLIAILSSSVTYFFVPTKNIELPNTSTPFPTVAPDNGAANSQNTNNASAITKIFNDNCDAVVIINSYSVADGVETFLCQASGFFITDDGYIITNNHCVKNADKVKVTLYNGKSFDSTIVGTDERSEIAVLKVESNQKFSPVTLGNSDNVQVGEYAIALGHPLGYTYSLSVGFVSNAQRLVDSDNFRFKMIQTDVALNSGNSGGPLFNINGQVIGVNTLKSVSVGETVEGVGFAIPINTGISIAEQLIKYGAVKRAAIQATVKNNIVDNDYSGVLIVEVNAGGAAEAAGIVANDVLIEFNNKKITVVNDLMEQLEYVLPGDTVSAKVLRNGQEITVSIKLGET